MTGLDEFSRIIQEQGERNRIKDDEFLEHLQSETSEAIKSLPTQSNEYLVAQLLEYRGHHDPRVVMEYARFKDHVKVEIFKRMKEH